MSRFTPGIGGSASPFLPYTPIPSSWLVSDINWASNTPNPCGYMFIDSAGFMHVFISVQAPFADFSPFGFGSMPVVDLQPDIPDAPDGLNSVQYFNLSDVTGSGSVASGAGHQSVLGATQWNFGSDPSWSPVPPGASRLTISNINPTIYNASSVNSQTAVITVNFAWPTTLGGN